MSREARRYLPPEIGVSGVPGRYEDGNSGLGPHAAHQVPCLREDREQRVDRLPRCSVRAPDASIVLLGTGTVGTAFLQRLARLASTHGMVRRLRLTGVANSRIGLAAPHQAALDPRQLPARGGIADLAGACVDIDAVLASHRADGQRIVIDATGSDAIASRHAAWLSSGVDVVTASKLAIGGTLARWQAVRAAQCTHGKQYGDSATVGAGLPILRTLRELIAGGDRVHAIAATLSGSLAWLFSQHDGRAPFSSLVVQAKVRGYTEPDPRQDLSGDDVRRKLLILARTAGDALDEDDVEVESLAATSDAEFAARLRPGRLLRHVARWRPGHARIALESMAPDDPLAQGEGCDNRVALWSDRYRERPLILQGPGAGAEVTAAALLDDVLAIARPG